MLTFPQILRELLGETVPEIFFFLGQQSVVQENAHLFPYPWESVFAEFEVRLVKIISVCRIFHYNQIAEHRMLGEIPPELVQQVWHQFFEIDEDFGLRVFPRYATLDPVRDL